MKAKITKPMNTPEQAQAAAQNIVAAARASEEKKANLIESVLNEIEKINPELGGFEEISVLLSMPDEQFAVIAPIFLDELEKSYNNVNDQLAMVQAMNVAGIKAEDAQKEYLAICNEIDSQMGQILSAPKRDFIKRLLALTYNAVSEAEGVTKRNVLIPIEYCREDAKMPAYANLSDAGMDLYATEDIDIDPGETKLIPTGIKCALPLGYALLIHPRSGTSLKTKLRICNSIGLIDAGYRGEIGVIVENIEPKIKDIGYTFDDKGEPHITNILYGAPIHIAKGERFAQMRLVEVPKAVFYEVEDVSGIGEDRKSGFGGTGKF